MCREGNATGGDERMMEIQALQEDLALQTSSGTVSKADVEGQLASVRKCLVLMKEQGLGGGAFTKSILHHGYDICLKVYKFHCGIVQWLLGRRTLLAFVV